MKETRQTHMEIKVRETVAPEKPEKAKLQDLANKAAAMEKTSGPEAAKALEQRLNERKPDGAGDVVLKVDDKLNQGRKMDVGSPYCEQKCINVDVKSSKCMHS